ncbi:MAG: InlB B-repeat-containing protein [Bacteroidales bacterium]|nr:InlB B-repeat-containing protein [Bacteroidales bacterium]
MKKLVQRFALLALMLLPMLTYGQVSVAVNYTLRGSYTVTVDGEYEVVDATPSSANYIVTDDSWTWANDGSVITPDGSDIIKVDVDTWKFKSDVARNIRIKFFPKMCNLTLNAVNGTITDVDDNSLAAQYAYGTHLTVKATPANTHYAFSQWSDGVNVSTNNPYSFYITDDTELTATFDVANYTVTIQTDPAAAMDEMTFTVNGSAYDPNAEYAYMTDVIIVASDGTHYFANASAEFEIGGSTVGTGTSYTISAIGENTTVIYRPVASTFSLTVQSDDDLAGNVSGSNPAVPYNTTVSIEAIPSDGFDFLRWNDANTENPRSVTVTEDVVYTAFFKYQEHTLAFSCEVNGEVVPGAATFTVGDTTPAAQYPHLTALNVKAVPTNNYNFDYWKDNNVTTKARSLYLTGDTTLVAVLIPRNFDVDYVVNDKLDITLTPAGPYYYGESVTIEAAPKTQYEHEYEFKEWRKGGELFSTDNPCTFTVEGAMMLTAVYQGVEYTINAVTNTGDETEGTVSPASQTVRFGETYSLTATPNTGYEFKHWNEPTQYNDQNDVTDFALDVANTGHAYTWTASFGPQDYTVTVNFDDTKLDVTGAGSYSYNATATLTASEDNANQYVFAGWKVGSDVVSTDATYSFTVTDDITVEALATPATHNFAATNATPASGTKEYGETFTLTPATIGGKTFKNWKVNGVDGDTDPAYEFTMGESDMTIEAVYEDVNYTVTVNILPAEAATDGATAVAAPTNVAYEGTTSLTATASTHYHFVNWTGDDVVDAASATTTSAAITADVEYNANFAPNTYNVTINIYESTLMGNVNQTSIDDAEYGSVHTLVATPETGYQFVAWKNGDAVLSTSASYDYTVEGDATITAVFGYSDVVLKTFVARYDDTTVHVDAAWGTIAKSGVEQYTGEVTLTATAADAHHVFKGWSDGVMDAERTVILMSDTSFYAFFALDSHSVVYAANDANMGAVNGNGVATGDVVEHGTEIHLVAEPADHYHFVSWSDAVATADRGTETVEADVNVTATFAIDQVTITAAADANGSVTPTTDQTVDYGTSVTLTATPDYGYEFESWSNGTATVTDNPYTFDATATETWTATFVIGQFTVTTAANPANAAATLTGAGSYDYMTSVEVTTTPATGYVFDHFEDGEGTEFASMPFDLTKDTNVIAVFDSVLVNITAVSNDVLMGTVTASAAQAKYNTPVTLTASPVAGYKLVSWNDGTTTYAALNNDTTFTVPATDVTYTATFEAGEFEVAGVVADACTEMGTVSGTAAAAYGSTVTLTATANDGYHFVNWDNDPLLTDASHAFAVGTENTTHTAYFEANTYTLTVNVNEAVRGYVTNGGATVDAPIAVTFGEEITLEAVPNHGYQAAKWVDVDGNDVDGATLTFTYSVVGDASVTAMFDYMDYTVEATGTNCEVTGLATNGAYKYGQVATLTATPNEHYGNWKGWYSNDVLISEDATFSFSVESDSVLVARCDIDTHTVTLTVSNTARGYIKNTETDETIASDPVKYIYGAEINVEAVANEHYTFSKWNDDVTTAARTITVADADIALEAQFDAEQYDVYTAVADGQSAMGDVSANQLGVDYGTNVTITATPNTGYEFVNWTDDDDNDAVVATTASYSFDIEGNRHFTAHFDYKTFAIDITVPVKEMGYVEVYNENNELLAADSMNFTVPGCKTHTDYTIIANPKYGYNFANWTGDHTGTDATFVLNADDNVDVAYTANFGYEQFDVTLTANSDARGNVIGAGTYSYGNIINISAAANTGFHFVQWNDGNTDNPRALLIQNDTAFEAVFGMDDQNISQEGCNEVVWMDGEDTIGAYTTSGVYDHTFTDDLGVDYNVHNDVTVYTPQNTEETEEACFSFDWTYATEPLTESDVYNVDFTDVNGCEAVHTLNLTIYKQQGTKVEVNSCSPYTWEINGNTYIYDVADTYYDETVDANGCAKKDTLVLTFITPTDIHDEVTACDTYTWQVPGCEDVVYTTNTTTSKPYHDEATGCSATAYLVLTIQESVHTTETEVVACDEYDWTVQGTTLHLTESDNVVYEYEEGVCTNSVTLPLTINHSSSTVFDAQTACDSYEMTWTDNATEVFTTSGTYTHDYTSVENCPSTDEITITINNSNAGTFDTVVCDTYTWINAETYTADTTVEYTIANGNAVGCDSVVTLNLTVNYKVNEDAYAEACDTYEWNSINFTESGNITINSNGGAANGCDSITTLHLTIQHTVDTTLEAVAVCDQYEWIFNGTTVGTYTTSGDQVYEYVDGICEHNTATLPLTINTLEDIEETAMACETYTWNVAGQTFTYTEGGDKVETITDANGCTATATLHLTINTNPEVEETAEACDSYEWTVSGQTFTYTASGDYVETITVGDCTGTATLHLTINNAQVVALPAVVACDSYEFNGQTYTASEEISVLGTDVNGCDSTTTLSLTINNAQVVALPAVVACDSYEFNGQTYTASTEISVAGTGVNGCDSTTTLSLTINQSVSNAIALSDTGSVVFNNETFTTDTVVTVTYTAANGCDSTVTATITVIQVVEPDSLSIVIAINDATMGTTTPAPGTYYYHAGDTVSVSATANEGYQFVGWEISYSMFGYDIVDTIDVSSYETVVEEYYFYYGVTTMNLTAIFEADTTPIVDTTYYTVALFSADTTMGTVSEGDSVMAGESFTATAYPVNGYNFVAWMNGADTASIENPYTFIVNADITLTAIFEADSTPIDTNHYTVTIAMGDDYQGCSVSPLGVFVVPADTVMTVTATDTMGLVFAAWLDENDDTVSYQNPYTFTVNSDVTLYAIFDMVPTYTISVIEPSNGTITPGAGENIEVNEGADVTFTAVPDSGYMFAYWTIDGSVDSAAGNPYTFYNVNTDHVITATFEVDTTPVIDTNTYYYVTLINADTTMGTIAESDSVIANYPFTAYAIPFDGYVFSAWTYENGDTASTENPYIFVPTSDITLIANFAADSTPVIDTVYYTVTVNYDATMGTVTGEGRYVEGTFVTLRATANEGYTFTGWYDGETIVSNTEEYMFRLTSDVTLTAAFEAIPVSYTVTGLSNDTTMGVVRGSGEYVAGTTVTLVAEANEGYHFVRWSNGETTTSLTFTVTEDVTLIAYFEINDTPQAIDETDMTNVTIYSAETRIIVNGAEGKSVSVYDINGRTVSTMAVAGETVEFRMANTGVYLVKVGNAPAKRVLVVR